MRIKDLELLKIFDITSFKFHIWLMKKRRESSLLGLLSPNPVPFSLYSFYLSNTHIISIWLPFQKRKTWILALLYLGVPTGSLLYFLGFLFPPIIHMSLPWDHLFKALFAAFPGGKGVLTEYLPSIPVFIIGLLASVS